MTAQDKESLMVDVEQEARGHLDYIVPVHLDLVSLLTLVGHVQLALRHPANTGPSNRLARQVLDQIIHRLRADGLVAHAHLAELGYNPEFDA